MKNLKIAVLLISAYFPAQNFTKQDTLKGSDTKFRNFWNVKKYEIYVEPVFEKQSVSGSNKIYFEITKDIKDPVFQIDLQQPMDFKITSLPKNSTIRRDGDFIFIETHHSYKKGEKGTFTFSFEGKPKVAKNAPWDGGWVFSKDEKGRPWMSVAQEGIGASVWLPLKDIWSDEPEDGVTMSIITPKNLAGVGNGRLKSQKISGDKKIWTWGVKNPINGYSIVPTVGNLVNFKDTYDGEKGKLNLDYWVLDYNLEKAKSQFQQVKPMMEAFEYWFGAYPFYEDSYKLVETPYLGMEHQSNVAYGNGYKNGYLGRDWSGTGVGLKWDFIIIHESGHEWFANNITAKDQADMWIHEAFTCYSETLFTEKIFGKEDAEKYILGIRKNIRNDELIIGKYGVKNEGSGDMYWKGAAMLHTIRTVIGNDDRFREILRGLNRDFYHQTVTTQQIENYINQKSGVDFSSIFDEYLRTTKIPVLEYSQDGNQLKYRYQNVVPNFKLPIKITSNQTIAPTENWQTITLSNSAPIKFNEDYLITYQKVQ